MTEEELAAVKGRSWEEYALYYSAALRTETDPYLASTTDLIPARLIHDSGVPAVVPYNRSSSE